MLNLGIAQLIVDSDQICEGTYVQFLRTAGSLFCRKYSEALHIRGVDSKSFLTLNIFEFNLK